MTTEELINMDELKKHLNDFITSRKNRPLPPNGKRYNRTPIDSLIEKGLFSVEALSAEYLKMHAKKSTLPRIERGAIAIIFYNCIEKTVSDIKKENNE
jgi:hypothetical protein